MAGLYLHIPFCKKACHYCDFHFSTSLQRMEEMVEAICTEIHLKKERLSGVSLGSIYFGGGTPSLLSESSLHKIFRAIEANFQVLDQAEITLEANPDDLDKAQIDLFRRLPINRLSIGVQSFFEEDLLWMNRAHRAKEAEESILRSQDAGLENISIDLIYGFPLLSDEKFRRNLQKAIALFIPHISSYSLTVEPKTALQVAIAKGREVSPSDSQSAEQFELLSETLRSAGYEHYEISNFSLPGRYAVHNTNYWKGVPYLGIGPSAHGFDGVNRYFNVANNAGYLSSLQRGALAENQEVLSTDDRFNERVMTGLRTQWGIDLPSMKTEFGEDYFNELLINAEKFLISGQLEKNEQSLKITPKGRLYADGIAAELFTG